MRPSYCCATRTFENRPKQSRPIAPSIVVLVEEIAVLVEEIAVLVEQVAVLVEHIVVLVLQIVVPGRNTAIGGAIGRHYALVARPSIPL